jgi:trypsin
MHANTHTRGYINLLGFAVNQLQKVSIPVVDREVCNADYAYDGMEITETMFCAGSPTGRHDHCYGDSGGPVVDEAGVLVGIISWAKLCALPRYPGVSSRVAALLDFIEENL